MMFPPLLIVPPPVIVMKESLLTGDQVQPVGALTLMVPCFTQSAGTVMEVGTSV